MGVDGSDKRNIRPIMLGQLDVEPIASMMPELREVNPTDLLVDESYQRRLSERSLRLIRRIVSQFDWARFKPPVCAQTPEGLEVIDGQHTAIAAASHPGIDRIPVMVVKAVEVEDRAKAFIGHNKDRLSVTPMQMHFSALAAGDEEALTLQQVCERAGVTILRTPPATGKYQPGETIAVGILNALVRRRYAAGGRRVLQVLADAKLAPISATAIRAVEHVLFDKDYAGTIEAGDVTTTLIKMADSLERDAKVFAAAHRMQIWHAMSVILYRNTRKKRKAAG